MYWKKKARNTIVSHKKSDPTTAHAFAEVILKLIKNRINFGILLALSQGFLSACVTFKRFKSQWDRAPSDSEVLDYLRSSTVYSEGQCRWREGQSAGFQKCRSSVMRSIKQNDKFVYFFKYDQLYENKVFFNTFGTLDDIKKNVEIVVKVSEPTGTQGLMATGTCIDQLHMGELLCEAETENGEKWLFHMKNANVISYPNKNFGTTETN